MSLPSHRRRGGAAGGHVVLVAVALAACGAWAQEATPLPDFSIERLELNPGLGPLAVSGGELLEQGALRISVLGHYQREPLSVYSDGQRLALVRDRTTGVLTAAYGVLPWLELDAWLPVVAVQESNDLSAQGLASPGGSGVGSPHLQGRLGLLRQAADDVMDVALELGVGLPVGKRGVLARDSGTSVSANLLMGGRLGPVAPVLEAGVLLRPTVMLGEDSEEAEQVGSEVRVGAGLLTVGSVLRGELGVRAALSPGRTRGTLEAMAGARFAPGRRVELFALGGMGFGTEPGTPLFRVLLGVAFTNTPEPAPEPEVVYELVTPVPPRRQPAPAFEEQDEEESESDAWNEKSESGTPASSATPEASTDESRRRSQSTTVSPEADTDGDGVEDVLDACVRERGSAKHQGCPPDMPQLVTLTRERLVLNGQVFFETGSATPPEHSRVLDRAAQVLLEHPEIPLVVIEGHTDAVGGPAYNQALSKARAEAVRRYLIERGVPAHRLVARGYGPARPADTNATAEGREKNRRVEVLLTLGNPEPVLTTEPPR